jgi:hypothetical protein
MGENADGQPVWAPVTQRSQPTPVPASSPRYGPLMSAKTANRNVVGPTDLTTCLRVPIRKPKQQTVFTGSLDAFAGTSNQPPMTQATAGSFTVTKILTPEEIAAIPANPSQQQQPKTGISNTASGKRRQEHTPAAVPSQVSSQAQVPSTAPPRPIPVQPATATTPYLPQAQHVPAAPSHSPHFQPATAPTLCLTQAQQQAPAPSHSPHVGNNLKEGS